MNGKSIRTSLLLDDNKTMLFSNKKKEKNPFQGAHKNISSFFKNKYINFIGI